MELDLGCSAAVLRRRLNALRCTSKDSNFKVSCCLANSTSNSSNTGESDTKRGGSNSRDNKNTQREASNLTPDWTGRLRLVLQPTIKDLSSRRRQLSRSGVQGMRHAFCILFQPELLAKLLSNVPSLKAIAIKTGCTVKLRDALLFKRLLRSGCRVKYMMFLVEGETSSQVETCLRLLEDFDSAFALRRSWKGRNGYGSLVLRWNKHVPENTLLSIHGQRLVSTSRLFCCSPVGPNTGWVRPSARAPPSEAENGGAPAGLLG